MPVRYIPAVSVAAAVPSGRSAVLSGIEGRLHPSPERLRVLVTSDTDHLQQR